MGLGHRVNEMRTWHSFLKEDLIWNFKKGEMSGFEMCLASRVSEQLKQKCMARGEHGSSS